MEMRERNRGHGVRRRGDDDRGGLHCNLSGVWPPLRCVTQRIRQALARNGMVGHVDANGTASDDVHEICPVKSPPRIAKPDLAFRERCLERARFKGEGRVDGQFRC
jgi:hypothetical protein